MAVEVALNTPLAEALTSAIRPKLVECGWATDGGDDSALSEYILLMLVNGKTQGEIAGELAGDLLNLGPDDPIVAQFAQWLFDQITVYNTEINGGDASATFRSQAATDAGLDQEMEISTNGSVAELNAPTGPRSMRNGDIRGGRGKRILGQVNRAMDRSHDSVLHRVRGGSGNERINAHNRLPPSGPRGAGRMGNRNMSNRANNIAHGMAAQMQGMPGMNMNDPNFMMAAANANGQGDIFALLQQQNQMMAALSQQLAESQRQNQQGGGRGRGGRSLFDRTERGRGNRRGGHFGNGHQARQDEPTNGAGEGEDVDMGERQPPNPDTTICKYNLACTNKDCKFAHQSPAAPPGITVDVNDVCSYGAACKNFKCVAKHPSPATRRAHQNEQECKFFPNCTNPKCPFKHPEMPPCRNGGDCQVEGCKFTHIQTLCKYSPCTNRFCPYKHEEGQRGTFQDKVWTANGGNNGHVSERQFTSNEAEEKIMPGFENHVMDEEIA